MPGKRATSRVERAILLLTALKPGRMGAERARLLNKEQRQPSVLTHSVSQRSDFLRITPPTKRQKNFALSARVPSFERDRPPGGPPLVTPQLNGGPARRAVNKEQRRYFVLTQIQRSDFLRNTHHQLNGKNPSHFLRGSRPLKGTALRAGPR